MSDIKNTATEKAELKDELTEKQQDDVSGGLNPQPLPPAPDRELYRF